MTFKVSFDDSNERLFEAFNIVAVINYLTYDEQIHPDHIVKIEELPDCEKIGE